MHKAVLLGAVAMLTIAGSAQAQAPGAGYPQPGMQVQRPPMPQPPRAPMAGRRWGSQVGGRWWGGANAPGGWAAYRQPSRGYRVPSYWIAPRFYVSDWSRYGLYAPTGGYNWVRYYDDAVLIDGSGNVSDWRGGLAWDGADYAYDERRDGGSSGIGGAVAGAVVGGVVGNVVAGRGNRLGGTLIGAGVGTALGYGVDRAAAGDGAGRRRDTAMAGVASRKVRRRVIATGATGMVSMVIRRCRRGIRRSGRREPMAMAGRRAGRRTMGARPS